MSTPDRLTDEEPRVTLTDNERETALAWLRAHHADEGGGLGGLWAMIRGILAARLAAQPPATDRGALADRVQAQADAVRQSLAGIGHLKTAQRALVDLGVAWDDAGRVLSAVQHAYVARVNAALLAGRSDDSPEGGA